MRRRYYREALDLAYETRRRFLDEAQAHMLYVHTFFALPEDARSWLDFEEARVGAAICITEESEDTCIVIDDRDDVDITRGEFPPEHPYVKRLLGKKVGESVLTPTGLGETVIGRITSKYVYALNRSLNIYQRYFPDKPGIERFRVTYSDEGTATPEAFQPLFDKLDERQAYHENIMRWYEQRKLTVGSLACFLGVNPIDAWVSLTETQDPGLICCSGDREERERAIGLVRSRAPFIVDIISLMTLQSLNTADLVVQTVGRLQVARTTLELIEQLLWDRTLLTGARMTIGKEGDHYVRTLITEEMMAQTTSRLESIIEWTDENCLILPVNAHCG